MKITGLNYNGAVRDARSFTFSTDTETVFEVKLTPWQLLMVRYMVALAYSTGSPLVRYDHPVVCAAASTVRALARRGLLVQHSGTVVELAPAAFMMHAHLTKTPSVSYEVRRQLRSKTVTVRSRMTLACAARYVAERGEGFTYARSED